MVRQRQASITTGSTDTGVLTFDPNKVGKFVAPYAGLFICPGEGRHGERVMKSYELIFVRKGVLYIGEEDERFVVRPNEALLLRKGRCHFGTRAYAPDLTFYWLHFDLPRASRKRKGLMTIPRQVALPAPERLAELFQRLLHDRECGILTTPTAGLMIALMLIEVAQAAAPPPREPTGVSLAAQAARFIATHYHDTLGTTEVANGLRCKADYVGRVFRRTYGYTLTEAIHRRRVFEARILLAEGPLNIDEIARKCGFGSTSYMCKIFGREVGMTPTAYRRLHTRYSTTINTV